MSINQHFLSGAVFFCLLVNLPSFAHANETEGGAGHGGSAMVCANSVEMLDLFEGVNVYGLHFSITPNRDALATARAALNKLANYPIFQSLLSAELEAVLQYARVLAVDTKNIPTDDIFPIVTEVGCSLEPAAVYLDGQNIILIDQTLFNAMDVESQAALYLHEAVYKIARDHAQATNSISSRKIVAYLLSTSNDLSPITLDLVAFQLVPYPVLGKYRMPAAIADFAEVDASSNSEGIVLSVQTADVQLQGCAGTYHYESEVDGLERWSMIGNTSCTIDSVPPAYLANRPSSIFINVGSPNWSERVEASTRLLP
jgi:hypothetical protein